MALCDMSRGDIYGRKLAFVRTGAACSAESLRTATPRIFDFERCGTDERRARGAEYGDALWRSAAAAEPGLDRAF